MLQSVAFLCRRQLSCSPELVSVFNKWKGGSVDLIDNGSVSRLVLNRPDKNNCISGEMAIQLGEAVDKIDTLKDAAVVVVEGKGKSFCSGADLGLIDQLSTPELGSQMYSFFSGVLTRLRESSPIVVAKLHGHCLGGSTEIATSCDIRIAHKDTKIGFMQSRMGIVPSWGGASWLAETVGRSTSLRLMSSAALITAPEALRIGYVDVVYETEEEAEKIIKSLSHPFPYVSRAQKKMLNKVLNGREAGQEVIREVWGNKAQLEAIHKQLQAIVNKKT